jgi:stearoyl-CoA desaturase (delta-9 desaturase)
LEKKWWLAFAIYLAHVVVFYVAALAICLFFEPTFAAAAWTAYGATMWGTILRTVAVWHITWSVNSLSHTFGYQSYSTGERSRNNWFVAFIASGEGWHNNHHHDPASASVQHKWWEFDLTYYHIKLLEACGLAKSVIKPRHVRHMKRKNQED